MIDMRKNKVINHGIEEYLQNLSDTDIMMNFLEIIKKIYPNFIRINAHCYDSWDSMIEPLYFTAVYETFSWKYGIKLEQKNCHVYEAEIFDSNEKNHIEFCPKKYPLVCESYFQERHEFSAEFFQEHIIVFVCFSDGENSTTGIMSIQKAKMMEFTKANVRLISKSGDKTMDRKHFFINTSRF